MLAPDYYEGMTASTVEEAKILKKELNRQKANKIMKRAVKYLLSHPRVTTRKIGVIGFSLGCSFALWLARNYPQNVTAVVLFYGTSGGKYDKVQADFQGHYADNDQWGAHPSKVKSFKNRLLEANTNVEFFTYKDTEHWFFEENLPQAYNVQAATRAWERTIAFFKEKLQ